MFSSYVYLFRFFSLSAALGPFFPFCAASCLVARIKVKCVSLLRSRQEGKGSPHNCSVQPLNQSGSRSIKRSMLRTYLTCSFIIPLTLLLTKVVSRTNWLLTQIKARGVLPSQRALHTLTHIHTDAHLPAAIFSHNPLMSVAI